MADQDQDIPVRQLLARTGRLDLANAALAAGLPPDAQAASELVREHTRRVELAAGAQDDSAATGLGGAHMIDDHG